MIRHQNKHIRTKERQREREQEVGQIATGHNVAKINSSVKKNKKKTDRQGEKDEEKREWEGHRECKINQNEIGVADLLEKLHINFDLLHPPGGGGGGCP